MVGAHHGIISSRQFTRYCPCPCFNTNSCFGLNCCDPATTFHSCSLDLILINTINRRRLKLNLIS